MAYYPDPPAAASEAMSRVYPPAMFAHSVYSGAMIAVQALMCAYSLIVHLRVPVGDRRRRGIYLGISFAIFLLDSLARICLMRATFEILIKPSTARETVLLLEELSIKWYMIIHYWASTMVYWLGDGLLVYRCIIIWSDRWIIGILPCTTLTAFIAVSSYLNAKLYFSDALTLGQLTKLGCAYSSLTAATNSIVTILISWRLVQMRKLQSSVLEGIDTRVYLGAIGLVAESALPLTISSIFMAISYRPDAEIIMPRLAWLINIKVSEIIFDIVAVMSPQLIIWRVTLGYSMAHNTQKLTLMSTLDFQTSNNSDSEQRTRTSM